MVVRHSKRACLAVEYSGNLDDSTETVVTAARAGHILTFAPRGSDPRSQVLLPNLMSCTASIIAIDFDGALYRESAAARRDMGQDVYCIDPFGLAGTATRHPDPMNLLDFNGVDIESVGSIIAGSLVDPEKLSSREDAVAFNLLAAVAGYCAVIPEKKNISSLIGAFFSDDVVYNLAVVLDTIGGKIPKTSYQGISAFLKLEDSIRGRILVALIDYLNVFQRAGLGIAPGKDDTATVNHVNAMVSDTPATTYLVFPSSKLQTHKAVMGVWLNSVLNAFEFSDVAADNHLLLLDGLDRFGTLPGLVHHLAVPSDARQMLTTWDTPASLRTLFPVDWEVIAGRASAIQLLGNDDPAASREVIALMGGDHEALLPVPRDQQVLLQDQPRRHHNLST
jgi:type IV secretion system protein VirD4